MKAYEIILLVVNAVIFSSIVTRFSYWRSRSRQSKAELAKVEADLAELVKVKAKAKAKAKADLDATSEALGRELERNVVLEAQLVLYRHGKNSH